MDSIFIQNIFDWKYYVNKYKDLENIDINNHKKALEHFISHGRNEGRICCEIPTDFDWKYYVNKYTDINCKNRIIAYEHYINHGKREGRQINNSNELKKIEQERARKKAEDLLKRQKEEAERLKRQKEEAERLKREKEEAERLKREKEEAERLKRVSIVMAYHNRKPQTLETLKGFEKMYTGKYNFEVVIVDDNSDDENKLEEDIKQFTFTINLIVISAEEKGDRINPCTAYNRGFVEATGDIIIIQNPEIFHCGNIIEYILKNSLQVVENYLTFPVFSSPSFQHNSMLYRIQNDYYEEFIQKINYEDYDFSYEYYINKYPDLQYMTPKQAEEDYLKYGIKCGRVCNDKNIFFRKNIIYNWKGWYNHCIYNPRNLHFLSVISKNNLNKIGGFCDKFKYGLWYDDDDFLYRIRKITNVITLDSTTYFGVHQYHLSGSDDQHKYSNFNKLIKCNKDIFEYNKNNNIIFCSPFKVGLCFKLYVNGKTKSTRYEIMNKFLDSLEILMKYNINLEVVGVIDCKVNEKLKYIIDNKIDTKKVHLIYLNDNYGISYATNRGIIELINRNCDYIFCSDDDVIFKKYNLIDQYIYYSLKYNIHHLGYYPLNLFNLDFSKINDKIIMIIGGYSGCFYMLRKCDILNKGLLPILDSKYGYEHEIFTKSLTENQYDLINSNDYIELNDMSLEYCSGSKLEECNINKKPNEFKLIPYDKTKLIMNIYN